MPRITAVPLDFQNKRPVSLPLKGPKSRLTEQCLRVLFWGICLSLGAFAKWAPAQDVRVYTSVTDLSQATEHSRSASHSLTLFHAGKVYSYMDAIGEVVIFEPDHHRFILLAKDYTATEVPFAQLNHFLDTAARQTRNTIQDLVVRDDETASRLAAALRFQLNPRFDVSYDSSNRRLTMRANPDEGRPGTANDSTEFIHYRVQTARLDSSETVRDYLEYADWAIRLNYVRTPQSAYPESRLKLNTILKEKQLLPTRVELTMHLEQPIRLRADHQYEWNLQSVDRQLISRWERTLHSDQVRWVNFHEYQQHLLDRPNQ